MRLLLVTTTIAGLLLSTGCGDPDPTASAVTTSAIPTTYRFDLTSSCGERGFLGTYRVSVRDGRVVAARPLDPMTTYEPDLGEVPSLQDLADLPSTAPAGAEVRVELDGSGLPLRVEVDNVPAAIDDEECYAVADIRRLP
jgi:hypothetical protein